MLTNLRIHCDVLSTWSSAGPVAGDAESILERQLGSDLVTVN
jgi:hypothetical protein